MYYRTLDIANVQQKVHWLVETPALLHIHYVRTSSSDSFPNQSLTFSSIAMNKLVRNVSTAANPIVIRCKTIIDMTKGNQMIIQAISIAHLSMFFIKR